MAPPDNLQDLKDLLLTFWCQISQGTFSDLVEFMSRQVGAVLAALEGPTAYYGHKVLAYLCVRVWSVVPEVTLFLIHKLRQ